MNVTADTTKYTVVRTELHLYMHRSDLLLALNNLQKNKTTWQDDSVSTVR